MSSRESAGNDLAFALNSLRTNDSKLSRPCWSGWRFRYRLMNGYPAGSKCANSSKWLRSIRSVVSLFVTIVLSFVELLLLKLRRIVRFIERNNTRRERVFIRDCYVRKNWRSENPFVLRATHNVKTPEVGT